MNHFPYAPAKPLPNFHYSTDNFLDTYHFDMNYIKANITNRPHYHDFYQLYYVVSGTYRDMLNGESIVCNPGSVILTTPYTVHAPDTSGSSSGDFEIISFSFHADDFPQKGIPFYPFTFESSAYGNKLLPSFMHIRNEDKPLADKLMREIQSEYEKKTEMFLTKVFECLNAFLSLCAKASDVTVSPRVVHTKTSRASVIYETIRKIKNAYSQKWLIDDAAKASMMSRSTFTKNFREVTGMTYHDIVMQLRLMKSVELLRYTRKSIAEIAEEAGFSSNAHFTKECIKMFRLPPQPLRRKMAEITNLHRNELTRHNAKMAWSRIRSAELVLEHFNNSLGKKP